MIRNTGKGGRERERDTFLRRNLRRAWVIRPSLSAKKIPRISFSWKKIDDSISRETGLEIREQKR